VYSPLVASLKFLDIKTCPAKEKLGKTIEIMKEYGADRWAEKYEKELAALR